MISKLFYLFFTFCACLFAQVRYLNYICINKEAIINNQTKIMKNYNDNQIIRAIESISQRFITCFHTEANGYAFKYTDGTWGTAIYSFVHEIASGYNKEGKRTGL